MYAVVVIGGRQYRVSENDTLFVDRLSGEEGKVTFEDVLLYNDGTGTIKVGTPNVEGANVEATILDNEVKADKVIVFKKKRRKGYKVKRGHRQPLSQIKIETINT